MRTRDLVDRLSGDARPVPRDAVTRRLQRALSWGLAGDVGVLVALFGFGSDMPEQIGTTMFWLRLAFPLATLVAALRLAEGLSRPGAALRRAWLETLLPVAAMLLLAGGLLLATPREYRLQLMFGGDGGWAATARLVALSLPSLAAVLSAMRGLAPTRLALAGAGAGVLAGAQGLLVDALYCVGSPPAFWTLPDVLALAVVAAIGALIAPRCIRW